MAFQLFNPLTVEAILFQPTFKNENDIVYSRFNFNTILSKAVLKILAIKNYLSIK